jgi:hypothetical protein
MILVWTDHPCLRVRCHVEMARTMLDEYKTSDQFWTEAMNTVCQATNHLYHHKISKKTSYELLTSNKRNVSYFEFLKVSAMFYTKG